MIKNILNYNIEYNKVVRELKKTFKLYKILKFNNDILILNYNYIIYTND